MVFRKLLICISIITFVNSCIRTIPPEEVYISSTDASIPTGEPGAPGTDGPVTGEPVTGEPTTNPTSCEFPFRILFMLFFLFSVCNTCKIDSIKPTLTDPATVFTQTDVPGECVTTDVKCARTDTQVCTDVKMTANGIEIGTVSNNKEVTATLKCGEDGSYSNGVVTGITQLGCNFMACAEPTPCSKCNIDALFPQMEPGTSLTYKSFDVENLCKYYEFLCKRDDGKVCRSIELQVIFNSTRDGQTTLGSRKVEDEDIDGELRCNLNGEYIFQSQEITQLSCKFDDCVDPTPCTACNFAALTPQPADIGGKLVAIESIDRFGCTEAQVICFREDTKVCASVKLIANLASGPMILQEDTNTGTVQTTVVCRNNIVYPYGEREPVQSFSCEFTTCA
ncbi:hypothetical protein CRE_01419 [Caenorhabditis remanei]|uniref:DUF281 domain-containing protein n=1 Tax=Caenorhabditis remanei TaxID=31234 RepID=E3NKI8_CAERE|nr:hypothetical protein CRE_01419 [Caenorhabditis remanei]